MLIERCLESVRLRCYQYRGRSAFPSSKDTARGSNGRIRSQWHELIVLDMIFLQQASTGWLKLSSSALIISMVKLLHPCLERCAHFIFHHSTPQSIETWNWTGWCYWLLGLPRCICHLDLSIQLGASSLPPDHSFWNTGGLWMLLGLSLLSGSILLLATVCMIIDWYLRLRVTSFRSQTKRPSH